MKKSPASEAPKVEPITPAYRQVADQLRAQVLTGALAPGERLPNESELSVMFGVGRSTVREALRVLSSQHLIVTSRGVSGGSFVAHPDPDKVSDFLASSLGLLSGSAAVTVDELLQVRELFEIPAVRLATRNRTEAHLASLRGCVAGDRDAIGRGDRLDHNLTFHRVLLEATGNRLLEMMTSPIYTVLRARFTLSSPALAFWSNLADDHDRILAAVEAGDAEAAAAEMTAHLQSLYPAWTRIEGLGDPSTR
jgi:DNA-binding FadR family transcriptional regulator